MFDNGKKCFKFSVKLLSTHPGKIYYTVRRLKLQAQYGHKSDNSHTIYRLQMNRKTLIMTTHLQTLVSCNRDLNPHIFRLTSSSQSSSVWTSLASTDILPAAALNMAEGRGDKRYVKLENLTFSVCNPLIFFLNHKKRTSV